MYTLGEFTLLKLLYQSSILITPSHQILQFDLNKVGSRVKRLKGKNTKNIKVNWSINVRGCCQSIYVCSVIIFRLLLDKNKTSRQSILCSSLTVQKYLLFSYNIQNMYCLENARPYNVKLSQEHFHVIFSLRRDLIQSHVTAFSVQIGLYVFVSSVLQIIGSSSDRDKPKTIKLIFVASEHAVLRSKSNNWFVWNQNNMSVWSHMSTGGLLFQ